MDYREIVLVESKLTTYNIWDMELSYDIHSGVFDIVQLYDESHTLGVF